MPRRIARSARSLFRAVPLVLSLAGASIAVSAMTGCQDEKSVEWGLKHITDANPVERGKAIENINQAWRNLDSLPEKDAAALEAKKKKKQEFKDLVVVDVVKAYQSDALKDSAKHRKILMEMLAQFEDARAKPAFVFAIKNYKPNENDDDVKNVMRSVTRLKDQFKGDPELATALVEGLKKSKIDVTKAKTAEVPSMFGDALVQMKMTSAKGELKNIVLAPNDGKQTVPNNELTARQLIAAQALGELADKDMLPELVKAVFELASKVVVVKAGTADEAVTASPLTTGLAMTIGNSISKIGAPAIDMMMPYVKDDVSNPDVKAVKEKFKTYTGAGGSDPLAYQKIATQIIANMGLPAVADAIAPLVKDKPKPADPKNKDAKAPDIKPLLGLLISLPSSKTSVEAIHAAYDNGEKDTKTLIVASLSSTMDVTQADWLLGIIGDKKTEDDVRNAALNSALMLSTKDNVAKVRQAYVDAKSIDKPSNEWRVQEPTDTVCDPDKLKNKDDKCFPHPDKKAADGKTALNVLWKDASPKNDEVIKVHEELLKACGEDASCYLKEFDASAAIVDKMGFTKVTREGTMAGIKLQKAAWMFANFAKEDDIIKMLAILPKLTLPAPRSFVQMSVDRALKDGSLKVADAIDKLVKGEREKASETANREAAQLEPIAIKLRARANAKKG